MKFYWEDDVFDKNTQHKSIDILKEFLNQYFDNFSHLGSDYFKETIQPNIDLLKIIIDEWKDDSNLEFYKIMQEKENEIK